MGTGKTGGMVSDPLKRREFPVKTPDFLLWKLLDTLENRCRDVFECKEAKNGLSLVERVKSHKDPDFIEETDDNGSPPYLPLKSFNFCVITASEHQRNTL